MDTEELFALLLQGTSMQHAAAWENVRRRVSSIITTEEMKTRIDDIGSPPLILSSNYLQNENRLRGAPRYHGYCCNAAPSIALLHPLPIILNTALHDEVATAINHSSYYFHFSFLVLLAVHYDSFCLVFLLSRLSGLVTSVVFYLIIISLNTSSTHFLPLRFLLLLSQTQLLSSNIPEQPH